jgi:FkbM family methyltransferase
MHLEPCGIEANSGSKELWDQLQLSPHRAGEVEFLSPIVRPGMRVIEAGANTGITAIAVAKHVGETGHVYAFEPVSQYCADLQDNLSRYGVRNVSVYMLALSNQTGRIRFYKHGEGSGIAPSDDAEMLWVEATTITDFLADRKIGRIDLLNLDCEGSEPFALQGAESILKDQAPQIFCEIHHAYLEILGQSVNAVTSFLTAIGYDVRPVDVENLAAETSFEKCSHIYARRPDKAQNAEGLKRKIADLKKRMPVHSARPAMVQELEELEEQLKMLS